MAAPVAVAVPEAIAQASTQALAALWAQAQELANQSLRQAQAAWDAERGELEQMRADLKKVAADAEGLCAELAATRAKAEAAEHAHQEHRKEAAKEAQRCADKVVAAQGERDKALRQACETRESASRLAGQLEAVQAQNAALMEALRTGMAGRE